VLGAIEFKKNQKAKGKYQKAKIWSSSRSPAGLDKDQCRPFAFCLLIFAF
jgi:hypothetical protein